MHRLHFVSTYRTLQKVLASPSPITRHCALIVRHGAEDVKFGVERFVQIHDGRYVATAVAVIWCGPHGHDVLVFEVILGCVSGGLPNAPRRLKRTLYPSLTS